LEFGGGPSGDHGVVGVGEVTGELKADAGDEDLFVSSFMASVLFVVAGRGRSSR
jgi:hypothetical protein